MTGEFMKQNNKSLNGVEGTRCRDEIRGFKGTGIKHI